MEAASSRHGDPHAGLDGRRDDDDRAQLTPAHDVDREDHWFIPMAELELDPCIRAKEGSQGIVRFGLLKRDKSKVAAKFAKVLAEYLRKERAAKRAAAEDDPPRDGRRPRGELDELWEQCRIEMAAQEKEMNMLKPLSHRNIVELKGPCRDEDGYVVALVMERCDTDLDTLLHKDRRQLTRRERLRIARGTASGMKYLHAKSEEAQKPSILHRDLKPANLLLTGSLDVKICDFHLSRPIEQGKKVTGQAGTWGYMAPEVYEGACDGKADVWSYGMCLYEIFTSQRPHDLGMSEFELAFKVKDEGYRSPMPEPEDEDDFDKAVRRIYEDCTEKSPADRPSFDEIFERLEKIEEVHADLLSRESSVTMARKTPATSSSSQFDMEFGAQTSIAAAPAGTTRIHNLPCIMPQLLGRRKELGKLAVTLLSGGSLASLTGIAGVGKSQLAIRFARDFMFLPALTHTMAWVLDASSETQLVASYREALSRLTGVDVADIVKRDLTTQALADELLTEVTSDDGRQSLLIFDNVPAAADGGAAGATWLAQRFFSSSSLSFAYDKKKRNVRFLFTSQSNTLRGVVAGIVHTPLAGEEGGRGHGRAIAAVEVRPLEEDAGVALLLGPDTAAEPASENDLATARRIHERLGGLPLALSLTRQYMTKLNESEKVSDASRPGRLQLEKVEEGLQGVQDAVAKTISNSLDLVREKHPRAWAVLGVAAWVGPKDIPQGLVLHAPPALDGAAMMSVPTSSNEQQAEPIPGGRSNLMTSENCTAEDIRVLLELHLLTHGATLFVNAEGNISMERYSMHCLLQAAARRMCSAEGALDAVYDEMALYRQSELSTWARARAAVPHAEALHSLAREGGVADKVALAQVIGTAGAVCYTTLGDFGRALTAYQNALRIRRAANDNDDDHPNVVTALTNIGNVYDRQGRYAEALEAYEEALPIARAALGDDHPDVASTRNNMGNVYQNLGLYTEALDAYEEALRIKRAVLSDHHPDVAGTLSNMGLVYKHQGRYAEALEAYKEALPIMRSALGNDHPDVATTLNNIGIVYKNQGHYAEALEAYEEALRITRAAFGDDHSDLASTLNNKGVVYNERGRYAEALEAFKEALRIQRDALGDDHSDVAATQGNMGIVYERMGRYPEALEAHKEDLRITRAALGDGHPKVAMTHGNIGSLLASQGRLTDALEAYGQALRIFLAVFDEDHPLVAQVRSSIAVVNNMILRARLAEVLRRL